MKEEWSGQMHSLMPAWHVVSLVLPVDIDEAFADRLRSEFGVEPVQLDRPHSIHTWLELYLDNEEEAAAVALRCQQWSPPVLAVAVRKCDSRDWESFWKTHFHARCMGRRLFVKPVWSDDEAADPHRKVLQFVPGLSFGTGEHFTTRFCLEMIDALVPPAGNCRTLWDVGCGGGMLGTAAAVLGMDHVLGTDNDPMCCVQSAENATLNGVSHICQWRVGDLLVDPPPGTFDLVCANLFAPLLIQAASTLWSATGRYLVLSGIQESEGDAVADCFMALGAKERIRDGDGAWIGLLFERGREDGTR